MATTQNTTDKDKADAKITDTTQAASTSTAPVVTKTTPDPNETENQTPGSQTTQGAIPTGQVPGGVQPKEAMNPTNATLEARPPVTTVESWGADNSETEAFIKNMPNLSLKDRGDREIAASQFKDTDWPLPFRLLVGKHQGHDVNGNPVSAVVGTADNIVYLTKSAFIAFGDKFAPYPQAGRFKGQVNRDGSIGPKSLARPAAAEEDTDDE